MTSPTRRRSDPSIAVDMFDKGLQNAKDPDHASQQSIPNGVIDDGNCPPIQNGLSNEKEVELSNILNEEESKEMLSEDSPSVILNGHSGDKDASNMTNGHSTENSSPEVNGASDEVVGDNINEICHEEEKENQCSSLAVVSSSRDQIPSEITQVNGHMCNGNQNGYASEQSDELSENSDSNDDEHDICDNESTCVTRTDSEITLQRGSSTTSVNRIESSTDTLCEEDSKTKNGLESSCDQSHDSDNKKSCDKDKDKNRCDTSDIHKRTAIGMLQKLESSSSISTSTSDISSSHIDLEAAANCYKLPTYALTQPVPVPLRLDCSATTTLKCMANGMNNGLHSPMYPPPGGAKTPNSTCPPTPDTKVGLTEQFIFIGTRYR